MLFGLHAYASDARFGGQTAFYRTNDSRSPCRCGTRAPVSLAVSLDPPSSWALSPSIPGRSDGLRFWSRWSCSTSSLRIPASSLWLRVSSSTRRSSSSTRRPRSCSAVLICAPSHLTAGGPGEGLPPPPRSRRRARRPEAQQRLGQVLKAAVVDHDAGAAAQLALL